MKTLSSTTSTKTRIGSSEPAGLFTPAQAAAANDGLATFSNGQLSVLGNNASNSLRISSDAGQLFVNNGAVPLLGGPATLLNTTHITAFGLGGDDVITLDESNGALPRAMLFGGAGNDTLSGGSASDMLFGQADNDTLNGRGGNDVLFGGSGNDVLVGGDGDDQMFGEAGDDRLIWNPGDDNDLMEGGSGTDTAEVNGGNGAEAFTATANGTRVRLDRVNPAPFTLDIGSTEQLVVNMNGGDDTFSATGNLAALISVKVDGGAGNDTILGSNGNDTLIGGDGNDFIDGQQGTDIAFMGAGEDVFQWDPGDGNDFVDGGEGVDTMLFNGSGGNEVFEAKAFGSNALFTRNLGNIVMDLDAVERIELNALGGSDTLTVGDLSGADVQELRVSLAGTLGGSTGDGAADTVVLNGTGEQDFISVLGGGNTVSVIGLPAFVQITQSELGDSLVVNGGDGDDQISASSLLAAQGRLTLDGGAGDDQLAGGQGDDVLIGGDGDDFIDGNQGNDLALMGAGDDTFIWAPGEGNDTLEGGDGTDSMTFLGSNASENIAVSANGGRVTFFRDVATVTMDLNDVERTTFNAFGGADNIVIGDLSGTELTRLELSLIGGSGQASDGVADTVTQNGTNGGELIEVSSSGKLVTVAGLHVQTHITGADAALDRLTINGQGGDDTIDAGKLAAGVIQLTLNGGLGSDAFAGSAGSDLINGGDGDDIAFMGAGDDTFVWNPGDDSDTVHGEAGRDTLLFNGANVAENINIFADFGRAFLQRDVASVLMDLETTEVIDFRALGGADRIVVNDLSGSDVDEVRINLAGAGGVGDGAADRITLNATAGDDVVQIVRNGNTVEVLGLAARVVIEGFEASLDTLVINGLAGDDVIEASGLSAGSIALVADGGSGNDVLVGGDGNDTLLGGEGDDVLVGGPGLDVLDGGPGDDIEIQG